MVSVSRSMAKNALKRNGTAYSRWGKTASFTWATMLDPKMDIWRKYASIKCIIVIHLLKKKRTIRKKRFFAALQGSGCPEKNVLSQPVQPKRQPFPCRTQQNRAHTFLYMSNAAAR